MSESIAVFPLHFETEMVFQIVAKFSCKEGCTVTNLVGNDGHLGERYKSCEIFEHAVSSAEICEPLSLCHAAAFLRHQAPSACPI